MHTRASTTVFFLFPSPSSISLCAPTPDSHVEKQEDLGLVRRAFLSPYVTLVRDIAIDPHLTEDVSDSEGDGKYAVTKLFFPPDFSTLQSDARILHQIQLIDNLFCGTLQKIRQEKENFLVESKDIEKEKLGDFASGYLTRLCELYLDANAEIASLITETSLVLANLFGNDDFVQQYAAYLKEKHAQKQLSKEKDSNGDQHDEDDDDDDEDDKGLDDFRKFILSESFNLTTEAVQFLDFQVTRFLFLKHVESQVLEYVVLESKNLVKEDEERRESLSALSRTLFCQFSVDGDDAQHELLECAGALKPFFVYFLHSQIART
jgi:hypothetical protein